MAPEHTRHCFAAIRRGPDPALLSEQRTSTSLPASRSGATNISRRSSTASYCAAIAGAAASRAHRRTAITAVPRAERAVASSS